MAKKQRQVPRICLVGAGHFGRVHLRELQRLQSEGLLTLKAVVVNSEQSQKELAGELDITVSTSLGNGLLDEIDAVVIATPSDTHADLIRQTLPRCHVLLEKPMAISEEEADLVVRESENSDKQLVIGHNYRFDPVIEKLKSLVEAQSDTPRLVEITMLNELNDTVAQRGLDPNLEFIHAFDIMDFLFSSEPVVAMGKRTGYAHEVSLRYGDSLHCVVNVGWHTAARKRNIVVRYPDLTISCDLLRCTVSVCRLHSTEKFNFSPEPVTIRRQALRFLDVIRGEAPNPMPADHARRILKSAYRTKPAPLSRRPSVAVIGGGVFGTNCALELEKSCDVTLFERHHDFMKEVSFVNQWRHHSGFHYPRSYDTIQEIRATCGAFEELYEEAILRTIPSYFCPSATAVEIPAERYVAACTSNYLSFRFEDPPADIVNRSAISLSLLSDEGVYDLDRLRELITDRLHSATNVEVELGSEVVNGEMLSDGTKRLSIKSGEGTCQKDYDYVINATYSNLNLLAKWFNFPIEPLRFDLYEMLLLQLDIDPICVTILDGPFTSLVGTGKDNLFLLSHIHDSVLKSDITEDGLPPNWKNVQSNQHNMLLSASHYLPILKSARVVESRFATRAVNAFARDFDARPTVVRNHGFGAWSVLGGKIITCVSNAREIASAIESAEGIDAWRERR